MHDLALFVALKFSVFSLLLLVKKEKNKNTLLPEITLSFPFHEYLLTKLRKKIMEH